MHTPNISILIPAHNSEKIISTTIGEINSVFKKLNIIYEIIVCDNASTDNTSGVATKAGAKVVYEKKRGISFSRNKAASIASGEIFFFIDEDTIISKKLILQTLKAFEDPKIKLVSTISKLNSYPNFASFGIWLYNLASLIFAYGAGHYICVKKNAFKKMNGFNRHLYSFEDIDFTNKVKKMFGRKAMVILKTPVLTSSRKFASGHSSSLFMLQLLGFILNKKIGKNRSKLKFWYGEPEPTANFNWVFYLISFIMILSYEPLLQTGLLTDNFLSLSTLILMLLLSIPLITNITVFIQIFLFTLILEIIGLSTGMIFGVYAYLPTYQAISVFGVPLFIPFAWFIIISSIRRISFNLIHSLFLIFILDVFLEKFAVSKGLWFWENPSLLAAPIQNYLAWIIISFLCLLLFKNSKPKLLNATLSILAIMIFITTQLFSYSIIWGISGFIFAILLSVQALSKGFREQEN